MKATPARVRFKAHLGQANHFLVTSLVVLHTLDNSEVETAPEVLHTSWNPKSKTASVIRSRNFVMQSFLGWAVDSIDMYITLLDRKPRCIESTDLSKRLQQIGRSVSKRLQLVNSHFAISPELKALADVLITWRNNVFHEANDNYLQQTTKQTLARSAPNIAKKYRGLSIGGLVSKSESGASLTFKETASLINAAHHLIEDLDAKVLGQLDVERYCVEAVKLALEDREKYSGFRAKYASLGYDRRKRFLATWLKNEHGLTDPPEGALTKASNLLRGADGSAS